MRLRRHYQIAAILSDFLRRLPRQLVVMDGTYFLNVSGPIQGAPVRRDLLILATQPVVADAVALRLMGWDLSEIAYLRRAARASNIDANQIPALPPRDPAPFVLERTFWNWVALAGFRSRSLTSLGYESPLAKPLHQLKTTAERMTGRSHGGEGDPHRSSHRGPRR